MIHIIHQFLILVLVHDGNGALAGLGLFGQHAGGTGVDANGLFDRIDEFFHFGFLLILNSPRNLGGASPLSRYNNNTLRRERQPKTEHLLSYILAICA